MSTSAGRPFHHRAASVTEQLAFERAVEEARRRQLAFERAVEEARRRILTDGYVDTPAGRIPVPTTPSRKRFEGAPSARRSAAPAIGNLFPLANARVLEHGRTR